jgi:hypothetical protein
LQTPFWVRGAAGEEAVPIDLILGTIGISMNDPERMPDYFGLASIAIF